MELNHLSSGKVTAKNQTNQINATKSCVEEKKKGLKKARKKFMSENIAMNLYYANPKSIIRKSYQNSIYCAETLTPSADGVRLTTHYCKNRWCPLCQSIRTAVLINGYKPQLEQFKDAQFVTLTRPTVQTEGLKEQQKTMLKAWQYIKNKREFRKSGWKGLLKRECTIRPDGFYHYHFHLIVNCKECAEFILAEWLRLNPDSDPQAQKIIPVRSDGSLMEIFKYFTKLIGKNGKGQRIIDYVRLDVVMSFMRGQRVFQPFGGLKAVSEEVDEDTPLIADLSQEDLNAFWQWQNEATDWVNLTTGQCLTGYHPNEQLVKLLSGSKE